MKKQLLLLITIFLGFGAFSQNLQWAKKFGANSTDQGQALTIDASANVAPAGFSQLTPQMIRFFP